MRLKVRNEGVSDFLGKLADQVADTASDALATRKIVKNRDTNKKYGTYQPFKVTEKKNFITNLTNLVKNKEVKGENELAFVDILASIHNAPSRVELGDYYKNKQYIVRLIMSLNDLGTALDNRAASKFINEFRSSYIEKSDNLTRPEENSNEESNDTDTQDSGEGVIKNGKYHKYIQGFKNNKLTLDFNMSDIESKKDELLGTPTENNNNQSSNQNNNTQNNQNNQNTNDDYEDQIDASSQMFDSLKREKLVQKSNGKWVNRGKSGKEHGEFDTKAEAEKQMKAMYAGGFKGESNNRVNRKRVRENFNETRKSNFADTLLGDLIHNQGYGMEDPKIIEFSDLINQKVSNSEILDKYNDLVNNWDKYQIATEDIQQVTEVEVDKDYLQDKSKNDSEKEDDSKQVLNEIEESYNDRPLEDIIEGSVNNMDDEDFDRDIKFYNRVSRLLKSSINKIWVIIADYEDDFLSWIDDAEEVRKINDNAKLYKLENDLLVVRELMNGNIYLYFKDEDDADKYKSYMKDLSTFEESVEKDLYSMLGNTVSALDNVEDNDTAEDFVDKAIEDGESAKDELNKENEDD